MRRLMLVTAVLALLAADVAAAAPGTPSLYSVPSKVMPNNPGETTAAFGWTDVDFNGPCPCIYDLHAADLSSPGTSVSTSTFAPNTSANLSLTHDHSYRISVRAYQNGNPGADSATRDFVFDNVGPGPGAITSPPLNRWFHTLNIPVGVLIGQPTDATQWQVDLTLSGWPCGNAPDPACPKTLTPNGSIMQGSSTEEMPTGDGIKYVFVRFRDDARHPRLSNSVPFFEVTGNAGPAPTARSASTRRPRSR